ncbi:hypothetical protein GCM10023082_17200 [Streptomyces tremellae]|uniref:ABC-2 type transporter transmembrane domain-containing protein n=1 Tax=Streptomyces tremellae TaxID=1124239 RepID=A0ABP7EK94_9ACTN
MGTDQLHEPLAEVLAGIQRLTRRRLRRGLMGIGQAIAMPLFFGSSALYPLSIMPGRLQVISRVDPLSYQVDALRGLLLGTPSHLALDYGGLAPAAAAGIAAASSLLARLAR